MHVIRHLTDSKITFILIVNLPFLKDIITTLSDLNFFIFAFLCFRKSFSLLAFKTNIVQDAVLCKNILKKALLLRVIIPSRMVAQ